MFVKSICSLFFEEYILLSHTEILCNANLYWEDNNDTDAWVPTVTFYTMILKDLVFVYFLDS